MHSTGGNEEGNDNGPTPMKRNSKIRQDNKRHQMEENMPNKHETMTAA
jgi:hypothetical protein